MTRDYYKEACEAYLKACEGIKAESTLTVSRRRLKRIGKELKMLHMLKLISTTNPRRLTTDDAYEIYVSLSNGPGLNGNTKTVDSVKKDMIDLNNVCRMQGNLCVDNMHYKYPQTLKKSNKSRLPILSNDDIIRILKGAQSVPDDNPSLIRAYGLVALYIAGGLRTLEMQHVKVKNIHLGEYAYVFLDFVKGQESYGMDREAALIPEYVPIIERYLEWRQNYLDSKGMESELFVFGLESFEMLTDKTVRLIRRMVEDDLGIKFDGRKCRRTYGQTLKNRGVDIEAVSAQMGHHSTNTTERYYARIRSDAALSEAYSCFKRTPLIRTNPIVP